MPIKPKKVEEEPEVIKTKSAAARKTTADVLDEEPTAAEVATDKEAEIDPLDDVHEDSPTDYQGEGQVSPEKGPKINFDYEYKDEKEKGTGEELEKKKEETLEDLANKYQAVAEPEIKDTPEVENESIEEAEEGAYIPQMKAQVPTSGIYSAQDVRKGDGQLHQPPFMKSSFSGQNNDNYRPNKSSKLHFVILALIGLAVLGSAIYLLKYQFKAPKPLPSPTPAPIVASPTPSPTPQAIDRSKYTLRILNGTGKSGLAASVAAQLKDLGYKIDKTDNTPKAESTLIKAKPGRDDLIKQLISDLASPYNPSSSSAALKSATSEPADAEVTLGTK